MQISDQTSAIKLAICDDIGERSYDFADVAAILVQMLIRHPAVGQFSYKLTTTSPPLQSQISAVFDIHMVFRTTLTSTYRTILFMKLRFETNLLIIFPVQILTQEVIYKQGLEMVDFGQPQNITYFATRVSDTL